MDNKTFKTSALKVRNTDLHVNKVGRKQQNTVCRKLERRRLNNRMSWNLDVNMRIQHN